MVSIYCLSKKMPYASITPGRISAVYVLISFSFENNQNVGMSVV